MLAEIRDHSLPAACLDSLQQAYEDSGGSGLLADHFEIAGGRATLAAHLRQRITWAQYSPVTDASFNEFDAILCPRALPAYGPVLRQRVLRLFHDSLALFGVLGVDRPLRPSDACAGDYQPCAQGPGWYKRVR